MALSVDARAESCTDPIHIHTCEPAPRFSNAPDFFLRRARNRIRGIDVPTIAGNQQVWVQGVGCGSAIAVVT
jgi:hypothetical protein